MSLPSETEKTLNQFISKIITEMTTKWTSIRGVSIRTALNTYHGSSRIRYVKSTGGATTAGWTQPPMGSNFIKVYVPYSAKGVEIRAFSKQNRAYHPIKKPDGWCMCGDGYYINRGELIVNLAHEGLHAAKAIAGDGCLEEEVDSRLAGNACVQAFFRTVSTPQQVHSGSLAKAVNSIKVDYPKLKSDKKYVPLGGAWPKPWKTAF